MRLRDIEQIINDNTDNLKVTLEDIPRDAGNKKVIDLTKLKKSFYEIEKTNLFIEDILRLKNIKGVFSNHLDYTVLPTKEANILVSYINQLKNKLTLFKDGLSAVIPEQNENSISIKLPKINDLKELIQVSTKLDKVFNQLLINDIESSEAKLQNFDTGSEWYEIVFSTLGGLWIFTQTVRSIIYLKREAIKNKDLQENVRLKSITNNGYEQVISMMAELAEKESDKLKEEQVNNIIKESGVSLDNNEYRERVKYAIDELSKLIDQGMKFFPSSTSTQEVKDSLPDFSKELMDMIPEIKKLEDKKE